MGERATNFPNGTCTTMRPEQVDKYFYGPAQTFERKIGRAICANCPALNHCFFMAVEFPPESGSQAGHTGNQLRRIRAEVMLPNGDLDYEAAREYMPVPEPLRIHHPNGVVADRQRRQMLAHLAEQRHGA